MRLQLTELQGKVKKTESLLKAATDQACELQTQLRISEEKNACQEKTIKQLELDLKTLKEEKGRSLATDFDPYASRSRDSSVNSRDGQKYYDRTVKV